MSKRADQPPAPPSPEVKALTPAQRYQQQLAERRALKPTGQQVPIPPFNANVENGPPAAQQAAALRNAASKAATALPGGIIQPDGPVPATAPSKPLPPRQMSKQGMEALEELQRLQRQREEQQRSAQEEEEDNKRPTAAQAGPAVLGPTKSEDSEIQKGLKNLDEFDDYTLRQALLRDILNNDEQREWIESRLDPLSLHEYLSRGRATQVIPIDPDHFTIELQSLTVAEEHALKRLAVNLKIEIPNAPDVYYKERYSIMGVAAALVRLNQRAFPSCLDSSGDFSDELFWKKFNHVVKLPFHALAAIALHNFWFDTRVRMLCRVKNLKNGS